VARAADRNLDDPVVTGGSLSMKSQINTVGRGDRRARRAATSGTTREGR
jgi:hypothetical protein